MALRCSSYLMYDSASQTKLGPLATVFKLSPRNNVTVTRIKKRNDTFVIALFFRKNTSYRASA